MKERESQIVFMGEPVSLNSVTGKKFDIDVVGAGRPHFQLSWKGHVNPDHPGNFFPFKTSSQNPNTHDHGFGELTVLTEVNSLHLCLNHEAVEPNFIPLLSFDEYTFAGIGTVLFDEFSDIYPDYKGLMASFEYWFPIERRPGEGLYKLALTPEELSRVMLTFGQPDADLTEALMQEFLNNGDTRNYNWSQFFRHRSLEGYRQAS